MKMVCVKAAWMILLFVRGAEAGLDSCFEKAGQRYGISGELLYAVAAQESGFEPSAVGHNADGSRDIGVMQINSWWLPRLAEYGIDENRLREPCTNVLVGAWILAGNIARYGYTWEAVGAYNVGTAATDEAEERRKDYANRVAAQLVLHRRARGMRPSEDRSR